MARIESKTIPLKTALSSFSLSDPEGVMYDSKNLIGKSGLLIYIVCNHCPYTEPLWERMVEIADFAKKVDIGVVAINPNIHPNYPEDSPVHMLDKISQYQVPFPYLIDADQSVSKALGATCTPEAFLFDGDGKLYYHGRIDDYWQDASGVNKEELRDAIMLLFSKKEPPSEQFPSKGCSIKWADTVTG
jgi:hypothetical protein